MTGKIISDSKSGAKIIHTGVTFNKNDDMDWSSMKIGMENTDTIVLPKDAVINAEFNGGEISSEYTPEKGLTVLSLPESGVLILDLDVLEHTHANAYIELTARERLEKFHDITDLNFITTKQMRTIILPYAEKSGLGSDNVFQSTSIKDKSMVIEWSMHGQE